MRFLGLFSFFFVMIFLLQGEEFFPVSQIKPGMRGVTLTVLQGTNIVSLETEILGVAEDYLGPHKDLIIGRLVDEKTKLTGAVHGMSGSPLYIEGKLVGALSRRIAMFEKDGHCGFTPIADMFEVGEKTNILTQAGWQPRRLFPGNSVWDKTQTSSWLSLPLSFGEISLYAKKVLEQMWGPLGFLIAEAGGLGNEEKHGGELQPGSPVAAAFLTGDLRMAGTGTLTWRKGNRILAFGHPIMNLGEVTLPMCEAEVISTIPSYFMPYKLANVRRVVGTVQQDRLSAIAGEIGKVPVMPRYRVKVQFGNGSVKVFEGHFVSNENVTPYILVSLIIKAIFGSNEIGGNCSVALRGQLGIEGKEPLNFDSFVSGKEDAAVNLAMEVARRVNGLYEQRLEKPKVNFFDISLQIQSQAKQLTIKSVRLEPQRPKLGQKVKAIVELKPDYGKAQEKSFLFEFPDEIRRGDEILIEVASGLAFSYQDELEGNQTKGVSAWEGSNQEHSKTLEGLIEEWNQQRSVNELVVRMSNRRTGVQWQEKRLENLPSSISEIMLKTGMGVAPILKSQLLEKNERVDAEVLGKAEIIFNLE